MPKTKPTPVERRVIVIHSDAGDGDKRRTVLTRAGYVTELLVGLDVGQLRAVRKDPPGAFVIAVAGRPATARDIATWLRQQEPTRPTPLVFAGGTPDEVAMVRKTLPDATFTDWRRIRGALRAALTAAPEAKPVVPAAMAGYSGTPLPKKLGIKLGSTLALVAAPDDFDQTLGTLPDGVRVRRQARGRAAERVMLFARSLAELQRRLDSAVNAMAEPGGGLWIAWPKRASGVVTDVTEAHVRKTGLAAGLVDYKIAAIDQTWSGLLFARRRSSRGVGASNH